MSKVVLRFCIGVLVITAGVSIIHTSSFAQEMDRPILDKDSVIERSMKQHGTNYTLTVDTESHAISTFAKHLADNETPASYSVTLNGKQVINEGWRASRGETSHAQADLMYEYDATKTERNVTLSTYGGSVNLSYNFTVPRKYEGNYLRPTVTDVDFQRVNASWGRMTVTVRSDSQYYYPFYVQLWTPEVDGAYLDIRREKGENVTTASVLLPIEEGEAFEGELRMHTRHLEENGPLHTQYEFYGHPGEETFSEVPYEPLTDQEVAESYEYQNESRSSGEEDEFSDASYRYLVGGVAVASMILIVAAVLAANRRRRP